MESTALRRPGGRAADVTRRINEAVLALLLDGGIDACTFQNIAARADIDRSTLYRRFPDRWPMIIGAIVALAERETPVAETGSFKGDLFAALWRVAEVLTGPLGPPLMNVAAALLAGEAPGERARFWESRRKQLDPMFDAGIGRGELSPDVDREEVFEMAAGPLYFRTFVSGRPLDEAYIHQVVEKVCDHYSARC